MKKWVKWLLTLSVAAALILVFSSPPWLRWNPVERALHDESIQWTEAWVRADIGKPGVDYVPVDAVLEGEELDAMLQRLRETEVRRFAFWQPWDAGEYGDHWIMLRLSSEERQLVLQIAAEQQRVWVDTDWPSQQVGYFLADGPELYRELWALATSEE